MNITKIITERFKRPFEGAEDFIKYEIGLITKEEYYAREQERVKDLFIPKTILTTLVQESLPELRKITSRTSVLNYDAGGAINLGTLEEWYSEESNKVLTLSANIKLHKISLKDYIELCFYNKDLERIDYNYSAKTYLALIQREALDLKSLDLTIASQRYYATVYNNVNLRRVDSRIRIPHEVMDEIVMLITGSTSTIILGDGFKDISTDMEFNAYMRGRVKITKAVFGYLITVRIINLKNNMLTVDSLSYQERAKADLRRYFQNRHPGLKIIAGPTLSGKNTTLMALLSEYLNTHSLKCVSVEQPVEQINPLIEQISARTDEEYQSAVSSLVRHNPDVVYLAEINDDTAKDILKTANTGKTVITTIHANSPIDVVTRIQDITGLSVRRITMLLDTVVFQRLIPTQDGKLVPILNYFHLDEAAHRRLNMAKTDEEIFEFLTLMSTSLVEYTNSLIQQNIITEEDRNEVI